MASTEPNGTAGRSLTAALFSFYGLGEPSSTAALSVFVYSWWLEVCVGCHLSCKHVYLPILFQV